MELHDAVVAYRAQTAEFFTKVDPRPTDDWVAEQVDRLVPLEIGGALAQRSADAS